MTAASLLSQARNLAARDLRQCYEQDGIIAGTHHFTDYWARDGYFAAFGSFDLGDTEIIQKMVRLFLSHQRTDGLIPYRIMRGPITIGKYFGKPQFYSTPKPTYRLRGFGPHVLDGTTLTVLWAAKLGNANWTKASSLLPQLKKALGYLQSRERYGLLWDGVMSEWNDVVWKWGNLLYSNIIYWKMLGELAEYLKKINDPEWRKIQSKQKAVAQALRARLWNGHFFADWYDYKRQDYLYAYGNCLAIAWGLTSPEETSSILEAVSKVRIKFTVETNVPKYPSWRVDALNHLTGTGDYQNNGLLWWQPGTAYVEALAATGRKKETLAAAKEMAQVAINTGIFECYERNGQPVQRKLYRAESPFAWASGLLVHTFSLV